MEHVKQAADLVGSYQSLSASDRHVALPTNSKINQSSVINDQGRRLISHFWGRMTELYGALWASSYGETPTPAWTRAILSLPEDQMAERIKQGLNHCATCGAKYPPTLPEFLAWCKPMPAHYRPTKALPRPPCDKNRARAAIGEIKAKLKGGRRTVEN